MVSKSYILVDSIEAFKDLWETIYYSPILAIDTETTGLDVHLDRIVGFSFSTKPGNGWYIPTLLYDKESNSLKPNFFGDIRVRDILHRLLLMVSNKQKRLIAHNASFDLRIIENDYGIDLLDHLWVETILAVHTVEEEGAFGYGSPFALKSIAKKHKEVLGLDDDSEANSEQLDLKESIHNNGGSTTQLNFEIYKADINILSKYACADTDLTLRVCFYFLQKIRSEGLEKFFFEEEVMPVYKEVTIPMEKRGVKIDIPLMTKTKMELEGKIDQYKKEIMDSFLKYDEFKLWVTSNAILKYPPKKTGMFAQELVKQKKLKLGLTKKGAFSLAKSNLEKLPDSVYKEFLLGNSEHLPEEDVVEISTRLWKEKFNDGDLININSKSQLAEFVFQYLGVQALSQTEKGQDQFNDEVIESLKEKFEWARLLRIYNKLSKIVSTYIERFIFSQKNSIFYSYFKQHGTVSGRYSSDLQQLPKPIEEDEGEEDVIIEYTNRIRAFFIARQGYKFIDSDYESLEPHIFASLSNDSNLQEIFEKGHDFYSTVAIRTEKLEGVSPDKKADNYLKKINPSKRQSAKAYCFTKDTIVDGRDGLLYINSIEDNTFIKNKDWYEPCKVLPSRESEVMYVHTNRGTLECTLDHPIYIEGEWVEAQYLKKGHKVNFNSNILLPNEYVSGEILLPIYSNFYFRNGGSRPIGYLKLDEEWSYFVGAMLGDGVISIEQGDVQFGHGLKGYVGICGDPKDKVVESITCFLGNLGYKTRVLERKDNCITNIITNSELCKIVYDTLKLGDMDADYKCKNLKIPEYIFRSSLKCKLAFIAGLLDTDGYLKNSAGKKHLMICSKDHRLSTGMCRLLWSLGVECSYSLDYNKTYKRNYYLVRATVNGGFRLNSLGLSKYLKCERKAKALSSFTTKSHYKKSRIRSPQVISVEFNGQIKEVFDITMPQEHCFYANGILVHNSLGVPYGMSGYALAKSLDIPIKEGERLREDYLNGFPGVRNWMDSSMKYFEQYGVIINPLGRVRHLSEGKKVYDRFGDRLLDYKARINIIQMGVEDKDQIISYYRDLKNAYNSCMNFQIQSMAASIVNRSALRINRELKNRGIRGLVIAQIHDQLVIEVEESRAEEFAPIVKQIMETTVQLPGITLKAPPEISTNFLEGH